MFPRRVTRFCARCGQGVTLLQLTGVNDSELKVFTDSTTHYHLGRLFLCSEQCCAAILKGFGSLQAFEEWALSPSSLVGSGVTGGEE